MNRRENNSHLTIRKHNLGGKNLPNAPLITGASSNIIEHSECVQFESLESFFFLLFLFIAGPLDDVLDRVCALHSSRNHR